VDVDCLSFSSDCTLQSDERIGRVRSVLRSRLNGRIVGRQSFVAMIKNTTTAEHYRWGDVCDGWRLVNRPDLSVIQERIPPGAGEVRHYHERARQLFFVLDGELEIEVRDEVHRLKRGDSLEVSPGDTHRVRNLASADASFLVVSAPGTQGDRMNLEP
jgi:mannose-6-phosphate isomerase-like protein (cupin superfamily)